MWNSQPLLMGMSVSLTRFHLIAPIAEKSAVRVGHHKPIEVRKRGRFHVL